MAQSKQSTRSLGLVTVILPGADRLRSLTLYQYRVTYKNTDPHELGCVMTWDVTGGRLLYQVAAERLASGELRWHCTCADAVYRGENNPHHCCKHVQGLLETMPTSLNPAAKSTAKAA
jgi:hypothetical protein